MPHDTDEQVRVSEDRPREEVPAYFRRLAEQNRPAVDRAIKTLTGRPRVDRTGAGDSDADDDTLAGEDSSR